MRAHDALPAPLRLWLKEAALPWSAQSARRVWEREVRRSGVEGALRRLAEVEAATLAREREVVWRVGAGPGWGGAWDGHYCPSCRGACRRGWV